MEQQKPSLDNPLLVPLLFYIQRIERIYPDHLTSFRDIHVLDTDAVVERIIDTDFSPGAIILLNKDPVTTEGFKSWLAGYRAQYDYLDLSFHNPVVAPSDPEGRGGTVGVTVKWMAQSKQDGALYQSQLVSVFEVTWFDDPKHEGPAYGRRMITKGAAAFGEITEAT